MELMGTELQPIRMCGQCGQPNGHTTWCLYQNSPNRIPLKLPRMDLLNLIGAELDRAYAKHGNVPWSRHEFYAILLEEVDELWADIKADAPKEQMLKELVQVAAMCFRYYETSEA